MCHLAFIDRASCAAFGWNSKNNICIKTIFLLSRFHKSSRCHRSFKHWCTLLYLIFEVAWLRKILIMSLLAPRFTYANYFTCWYWWSFSSKATYLSSVFVIQSCLFRRSIVLAKAFKLHSPEFILTSGLRMRLHMAYSYFSP